MTAVTSLDPRGLARDLASRLRARLQRGAAAPRIAAPPAQRALSVALLMFSALVLVLLVNLVGVSQVQFATSQNTLYNQLRLALAQGATPIGPLTSTGDLVALGTPLAVMGNARLGLDREVVVAGTTSAQTMVGVGQRIDTALPCQAGTSVLYARSGAYGAIGAAWQKLQAGDTLTFTMGQGSCSYRVTGIRVAGEQAPTPPTGTAGRLTLVTASGPSFVPTGVVRVDADLVGAGFTRPAVRFPTGALPDSHREFGIDGSQLLPLVLLLELTVALVFGSITAWRRWSRIKTAIVFSPVGVAVILLTADSVNHLLPNLL